MAAYVDRDTGHEEISTSTFYGTRKREVASVVLPPDGSYSNEGTSEDEEDDLYTEGQCQDSSSSSDQFSDSSSDDEAEEGANQSKSGRMFSAPDELSTPLTYFSKFFDEDVFEAIAHQTNLYSCQLIEGSINTNASEIKAFIGMKLMMGVVKMPAVENYWATDTRYDKIADVMPLKRYKCLSRMLHFQDNMSSDSSEDRLVKVRPVLDHMRGKCMDIESENQFSTDEMMVPYKGKKAGSLRQYLRSKPKKWGFKISVRAGVSGFVYDFMVYTGKSTFDGSTPDKEFGLGGNVVLQLCRTIRNPSNCVVYFDNFFTSLRLITHLKESMGLRSLDNDAKLAVVKWADSKTVTLVSSCASVNPVGQVRRYSKEEKKKISVPCPKIVSEYNTHMGGVDLADTMIALYRTPAKSHRWYLAIFWQMVDIAVNNAWLLHRRDAAPLGQKRHCLKNFRLDVAKGLIYPEKQKRGRPSKGNETTHHQE
ncbi:piggyBac transposable element-derived protein 3-like [Sparus aurata]|uniref:piggyBac transposable element-derived protein 3-like n=1 Tax=Sparus aurata TaxID=8175 RepID=UPI0011C165A3|nr:piggyBac transposable element-derived protein 3-like [Sparus aurata]